MSAIPTVTAGQLAVIYARISRDTEGLQLGVQRQIRECRELAERLGLVVVAEHADNSISGYSLKTRPGFRAMIADLPRVQHVLTFAPDRLTRHPRELEDLIDSLDRNGVGVHTVAAGAYDLSTSSGRLAARVVGAVARHESEIKSERSRAKHRQLAEQGLSAGGGRAYGYRDGGHALNLEPVDPDDPDSPTEVDVIHELRNRVLAGDPLGAIVRDLNRDGIPTARGKRWETVTVRTLLRNPRLAGLRTVNPADAEGNRSPRGRRIVGPAQWPEIITPAEHRRICAVLDDPRRGGRHGKAPRLLTGLLVCGKCGERLVVDRRRGAPVYSCKREAYDRRGCASLSIQAEPVEAIVTAALLTHADTIERPDETDEIAVAAQAELAEIDAERAELGRRAGLRSDDPDKLSPTIIAGWDRALSERQSVAERRLRESDRRGRYAALSALQTSISETWAEHPERRRTIAAELIESVTIAPWDPRVHGFDPGRVGAPVWRDPVKSDADDI